MIKGLSDTEYHREYRRKYPEKEREKKRRYRESHPNQSYIENLRQFNLTLAEYEIRVAEQDNLCAICGNPETDIQNDKVRRLAVDHSHKTNTNRALLCRACNTTIGTMDECPERLRAAATYLEVWA